MLTEADARRFMEEAVAERGSDYLYKDHFARCQYVNEDTLEPKCLIGEVLVRAGFDVELLKKNNGASIGYLAYSDAHDYFAATPTKVIHALEAAQRAQDNYCTWGDALKRFYYSLNESVGTL